MQPIHSILQNAVDMVVRVAMPLSLCIFRSVLLPFVPIAESEQFSSVALLLRYCFLSVFKGGPEPSFEVLTPSTVGGVGGISKIIFEIYHFFKRTTMRRDITRAVVILCVVHKPCIVFHSCWTGVAKCKQTAVSFSQ
ncbi:hypothetical protein MTO96_000611 [Rhipicephalus appendiculatus]